MARGVQIDVEILRISGRLFDRSKVTQNKINFVKNCPWWGLNPQPVRQEISEVSFVCFMHHFICWTLFISGINRA